MTRPNSFKPALQLLEDRAVPDAAPVEPPLEDLPPVSAPQAEAPTVAPPSDDANAVFVGAVPPTTADDTLELLFSDLWDEEIAPTETVVEAWDEYEVLFAVWYDGEVDASAPQPLGDDLETQPTEVPEVAPDDEATEPSEGADDGTVPISAAADDADEERGFWTRLGDFLSGFADEFRDQRDGLMYQLSDPWRAVEYFNDLTNPGAAALRRLANGEPEPIVVKSIQIANELNDDTGHGLGRVFFIGLELWATRRVAGAAGATTTKVPLAGAGPKVLPGAPLPALEAFKGPLAVPTGAHPKLVPVAIRKNGVVTNFENSALAPFGPFGALKAAEVGANEPAISPANLQRELSIWLQTAGFSGVAPERIKWYRDEFAKLTTVAERATLLGQLRAEVRGAMPLRLTVPGAPGEGNPLPSPVVGPAAPDAPQPQLQPQPATSGAGAMKPPGGRWVWIPSREQPVAPRVGDSAPQGDVQELQAHIVKISSQGASIAEVEKAWVDGMALIQSRAATFPGNPPVENTFYGVVAGEWRVYVGRPAIAGGDTFAIAFNTRTGAIVKGKKSGIRPHPFVEGQETLFNFLYLAP